jgi:hypothetical protein
VSKPQGGFYGDALVMLQEQDIVLHYLSPLPSPLQLRRKEVTEPLYGYDQLAVFSARSLSSRTQVRIFANLTAVLRIRICMLLGLSNPESLARGTKPDLDPSIIRQKNKVKKP